MATLDIPEKGSEYFIEADCSSLDEAKSEFNKLQSEIGGKQMAKEST